MLPFLFSFSLFTPPVFIELVPAVALESLTRWNSTEQELTLRRLFSPIYFATVANRLNDS